MENTKTKILSAMKVDKIMTSERLSEVTGINIKTIRNNLAMLVDDKKIAPLKNNGYVLLSNAIDPTEYIIKEKKMIVLPDLHMPKESDVMISKALTMITQFKIEVMVLPGDALDLHSLSTHDNEYDTKITYTEEMAQCKRSVNSFLSLAPTIKKIFIGMGNHEKRIRRISAGKISAVDAIKSAFADHLDKVVFIKYSQFSINNWMFYHPDKCRDTHYWAKVLSRKYTDKHIVIAHQHTNATMRDPSNKHYLIDVGCMADPDKLDYPKDGSRYPMTQMGFLYITGESYILIDEFWSL